MTFAARRAGIPYREYVTGYRRLVEAQLRIIEDLEIDVPDLVGPLPRGGRLRRGGALV